MAKLSPTQERTLRKLKKAKGWVSAYGMQESLATLNALWGKGLIKRGYLQKGGLGSFSSPQTDIVWKAK